MSKRTYYNRYQSINYVVDVLGELGHATATEISKRVNLSRQNILDVLKHAETWGYVTHTEEPYRLYKNGKVMNYRKVWVATEYGRRNAKWFVNAVENAKNKRGQLPLL